MLNLKIFFQSLRRMKLQSLFFVCSTILVFTVSGFQIEISSLINKELASPTSKPYFHTLLEEGSDLKIIQRKLMGIPGVEKVRIENSTELNSKVQKSLADLDLNLDDLVDTKFSAVKIVLNPSIANSKVSLIKEYISRLSPKNEISFSGLKKTNKTETVMGAYLNYIREYGEIILLGFTFVLWLVIASVFYRSMGFNLYLISQFQRNQLKTYSHVFVIMPILALIPIVFVLVLGAKSLTIFFMTIGTLTFFSFIFCLFFQVTGQGVRD